MENRSKISDPAVRRMVGSYQVGEFLGRGAYSEVFKGRHRETGNLFAIKIINNKVLEENQKVKECINNQLAIHHVLQNSPYVVRFYELLQTKNNCYFVYEFCQGGTLYQYLKKEGVLSVSRALPIFEQIVQGLRLLRKYNIMHRDLKPENVLIKEGQFKLADFGFGKQLYEQSLTRTMLGSPLYMAPQVLKGQAYTISADIWSVGVIFYQMIQGKCPFESKSIASLISTIQEDPLMFQYCVPERIENFIKKCLQKDSHMRYSWNELFQQVGAILQEFQQPKIQFKKKPQNSEHLYYQKEFSSTTKTKFQLFKQSYNKNQIKYNNSQLFQSLENSLKADTFPSLKFQNKLKPKLSYKEIVYRHDTCLQALQASFQLLQKKDTNTLSSVKDLVKMIKKVLEKIYAQTNIEDAKMLPILSIIKCELIQLQKIQSQFDFASSGQSYEPIPKQIKQHWLAVSTFL